MFQRTIQIMSCCIMIVITAGCDRVITEPTSRSETDAAVPVPTSTIVEPTEILPTATLEPSAPVITGLVDQTINDGEQFGKFKLSDFVLDEDHLPAGIKWQVSGNQEINIRDIGGILFISPPDPEWSGSETFLFEACDFDDLCDSAEIVFTVLDENDPPVINITDQIVQSGGTFGEIVLGDAADDSDHPNAEFNWQISGNSELKIQEAEGTVSVTLPNENWTGRETIRFEACDPGGVCGYKAVQYVLLGKSDVAVTYIGNAGFMITTSEKKILVDALFRGLEAQYALPQPIITLLENAQPPFDNVDLVLATHIHYDHFDADIVQMYMENNPNAIFVSTKDAVSQLRSIPEIEDRLISIDLRDYESTELNVNGIDIEALYLTHGERPANLGYIISVGETKFFHTGDLYVELVDVDYLEAYGVHQKEIDIAFVPIFSLTSTSNHQEIFAGIQARYLVLQHYFYPTFNADLSLMDDVFPNAIIFNNELENWVMP